ncbi:MAG: CBS domain-containing protein [Candidatus Aenigmarchaeota archaeon]|nr:CBS domain-containing protein [Candidatus Aenigmarchaeota archaeon]MDW8149067.1 CBS domain-containing protein [Candidatus Aenigmarchaeota archaeon]
MVVVKDIMSKPVISIDIEKTIKDAAILMGKNRIGCLVVTKKNKAVGILTDGDIIKKVVAKGRVPSRVKVGEVMGRPLIKVYPEYTIEQVVDKMIRNNVKRLCVVDKEGNPVGLVSLTDIAISSSKMYEILAKRAEMKEREVVIREETAIGICDICENYSDILRRYEDKWICSNCMDDILEE